MERLFNGITQLIEGLAVIAIVVTAFGLMLRILKPADAWRIGIIVGVVTALSILPQIVIHAWAAIPLWQQIGVLVLGALTALLFRAIPSTRPPRK